MLAAFVVVMCGNSFDACGERLIHAEFVLASPTRRVADRSCGAKSRLSECKELGAGQTECSVIARDDDVDLHGDALCQGAINTADDCNDDNPAIYGTATEICDGLDNDCNGKADLFDGLPLGGTESAIVDSPGEIGEFDIAWSEAAQTFGVVWTDYRDGAPGEIYYTRLDAAGNELGDDMRLTNDAVQSAQPRIASGGSEFMVMWAHDTTYELHMQRLSASDGSLVGTESSVSGGGEYADVIDDGQGAWILGWLADLPYVRKLSPTGMPVGSSVAVEPALQQGTFISLARASSALAVTYGDIAAGTMVTRLTNSQTLAAQGYSYDAPSPPAMALAPRVTEGGGQFLIAWGRMTSFGGGSAQLAVRRITPGGFSGCEALAAVDAVHDAVAVRAAAHDGTDFAIGFLDVDFAGTQSGYLNLIFVDASCQLVSPVIQLGTTATEIFGTWSAMARGGAGLAVLRTEPTSLTKLLRRMVPPSRCD